MSYIQFVILCSFRDFSVGQDTENYRVAYENINKIGLKSFFLFGWEPGFVLINLLFAKLGFSFRILLSSIGIFSYYSVFRFINKYSPYPWLSILIYIGFGNFYVSLFVLRQTLAIAVLLYGFKYIINRQFYQFCLIVILATSFHLTAILFLITYYLWSPQRISLKKFLGILCIAIPISVVLYKIGIVAVLSTLSMYTEYEDRAVADQGYGMLIFKMGIVIIGLLLPAKNLNSKGVLLYLLMGISAIFQLFTMSFSLLSRISWYWNIAMIAYLPLLIRLTHNRNTERILKLMLMG
ncbi:MAG: EpsG family protein, partial [Ruminococcus sp.]|nr:EpsG family protein [Ruminococcus sp.]